MHSPKIPAAPQAPPPPPTPAALAPKMPTSAPNLGGTFLTGANFGSMPNPATKPGKTLLGQ